MVVSYPDTAVGLLMWQKNVKLHKVNLRFLVCLQVYPHTRPSHHPVFDCLQYAKTGERPGPFYHVNDISVYLGRQRGEGSPIEITHFTHTFFILNQEQYIFDSRTFESPPLRTKTT